MTQKPFKCPECEGNLTDPDDSLKPCPLCHGVGGFDDLTTLHSRESNINYKMRVERRERRERFWKWAPWVFLMLLWIVPLFYATCIAN